MLTEIITGISGVKSDGLYSVLQLSLRKYVLSTYYVLSSEKKNSSSQETSNERYGEQAEQVKCVVCEESEVLWKKLNRSCQEVLGPGGCDFR